MKHLKESLLSTDYDLTDDVIRNSEFADWLKKAKGSFWDDVSGDFMDLMDRYGEPSKSMKRRNDAENHTVVSLDISDGVSVDLFIFRRGKNAVFSYVKYNWWGLNRVKNQVCSKGWENLVDVKNKRPTKGLYTWILPFDAIEAIYDGAPCSGRSRK